MHLLHLAEIIKRLGEKKHELGDDVGSKIEEILLTHCGLTAASGLIPIPGVDIAASAANIWTMYLRLNKTLNISFGDNIIKTLASGVASNLGAVVAGTLIVGSLLKFIPVIGTIPGAAMVAATGFGVTYVAGLIYLNAIVALAERKGWSNITEQDLKKETEEKMKDKEAMKDMINSAKDLYKKD
jgi:uncharacterized protein (DUF697 family)